MYYYKIFDVVVLTIKIMVKNQNIEQTKVETKISNKLTRRIEYTPRLCARSAAVIRVFTYKKIEIVSLILQFYPFSNED